MNANEARASKSFKVKAFSVICEGFPVAIYFAPSASRAKVDALVNARDAGYRIRFSDLRVRRAPKYDGATYCGKAQTCGVLPEYLEVP